MSDATDLHHHLEDGLLLFSRGMVFEAREAWRKALHIDPINAAVLDYLSSTERELNPYDRQRETESLQTSRNSARVRQNAWDEDEYEIIAAGPADEDEETPAVALPPITGFQLDTGEIEGEGDGDVTVVVAASTGGRGPTGWVSVGEEDEPRREPTAEAWPDGLEANTDTVVVMEASSPGSEAAATAAEDVDGLEDEPAVLYEEMRAGAPNPSASSDRAPGNVKPGPSRAVDAHHSGPMPETERSDVDEWEPLEWIGEDTPVASSREARGGGVEPLEGDGGASVSQTVHMPLDGDRTGSSEHGGVHGLSRPERLVDALMGKANLAIQEGQRDLARDLLMQVLQADPEHPVALQYLKRIDRELMGHYERILGHSDGVPTLRLPLADLFALDLDQVGGYILSRIDGMLTLDDIYTLSAHIDRLTVMRILTEMIEREVVTIRR